MALLEVQQLKKTYLSPDGTRSTVVDVPSFQLEAGTQVALEGSSGSGKTTFLNLIAGILRPDSGSVRFLDADLATLSEAARDRCRAANIGYIFQTFNLLQGYTALENVYLAMMFGATVKREYALHLFDRVGLADRLHYRPRQLSVGQQQRVAVARALANRPKLVLADEPTGNLDWKSANDALRLIRAICTEEGAALLLVSHDQNILAQFETVIPFQSINRAAAVDVVPVDGAK